MWFLPWNDNALYAVATHFLAMDESIQDLGEERVKSITSIAVRFHQTVSVMTQVYLEELGKYYYVTPISYTTLLKNLQKILSSKRQELLDSLEKYKTGVTKLEECSNLVEKMKRDIEALQPILEAKTKESEETMKRVQVESQEADRQKTLIQADEIETKKKADIAGRIQDECKEKLSVAEPELEAAIKALDSLKISDFVEMKAFSNPPVLIRLTMDAVCIMLGKPSKKGEGGQEDYWDEAKKLLANPNAIIKKLKEFDGVNIPEKVIEKMRKFIEKNPKFTPANVAKSSQAAEGLCKWCRAVLNYNAVNKVREEFQRIFVKRFCYSRCIFFL
jgi:dynein heavy chain